MDLNEQLKSWIAEQQQPGSFLDKAGLGLAQAGQTIGHDAAAGAAIMNDPRNSWIGMNPVGKAVSGGLGLVGMLSAGGGKAVLNPFMANLLKRGEELAEMYRKVDEAPDVFGVESSHQWLRSLPEQDKFAFVAHQNTPGQLAHMAVEREKMLNKAVPLTEEEGWAMRAEASHPLSAQNAMIGLGLNSNEFKLPLPPQQP